MRRVFAIFKKTLRYLQAALSVIAVTAVLVLFRVQINATTVALTMTLAILFIATFIGSGPAFFASVLAMLCFNYFFLPPVGTLTIADPQNWIALFVFFIVSLTAGQLSAHARRRTEEAEAGRREVERLYRELQEAFERASQAEALRRSEKLKSALLDAVTHDIRTPLTSIKASVTTLLEGCAGKIGAFDGKMEREMLLVIDEECDRLNRYTEKLLELARIEAGELRLHRRWEAVDELIDAALKRAEPLVGERKVEVILPEELPVILVDSHAVSEAIYSLLDNAAKYSPRGSTIRIEARCVGEEMEIAVEDEGNGIPIELRERVFDKFFRADEGAGEKGVGMGLAIARGIVEAHGGKIWIEDPKVGQGTRIAFTLPIGDDGA